ncbi:cell division protein FtsX [Candidatus Saccharibacteria bacterium]|nr:cell division protein FtsX [Candidatus Saccharibacteria bacterium]
MITLWRVFKSGFRNTFRNAWLSTAATAIMAVTLLIMTFFAFSIFFVRSQLNEVQQKIDLTVFISDDAKDEQIKALQNKVLQSGGVESVEFVSKADALKRLENSSEEGKKLAKSATEIGNPLPASLEVKLEKLDDIGGINKQIRELPEAVIITETSYDSRDDNRKGVIENVIKISNGVTRVGAILSIVFLVIALLIIFNTIRMAIFTRREEIEIMKLVGATKWFIRGPFIVEGSMYGVFGATIATIALIPIGRVAGQFLIDKFNAGQAMAYFGTNFWLVVLCIYALGIFIGAVSSWLAISRHLKL